MEVSSVWINLFCWWEIFAWTHSQKHSAGPKICCPIFQYIPSNYLNVSLHLKKTLIICPRNLSFPVHILLFPSYCSFFYCSYEFLEVSHITATRILKQKSVLTTRETQNWNKWFSESLEVMLLLNTVTKLNQKRSWHSRRVSAIIASSLRQVSSFPHLDHGVFQSWISSENKLSFGTTRNKVSHEWTKSGCTRHNQELEFHQILWGSPFLENETPILQTGADCDVSSWIEVL